MQSVYSNSEVPELVNEKCAVIYAFEILGGKWKLPIIWKLSKQEHIRYNELKRQLSGITNQMLTRSLRYLEDHNLVYRKEHDKIPPHVEYSLTDSGKNLIPALDLIKDWGKAEMVRNQIAKIDK